MNISRFPIGRDKSLAVLAACLLVSVLTLSLRPYDGIRHDSIIYFGQALNVLMPGELGRDLFFAYGSQSKFTVFPQILAYWLQSFDPATVSQLGLILAFAMFAVSSAIFARISFPRNLLLCSLLVLLIWPSGYGGFGVFRFQEPYLTGRSFAEPLVILAAAAMVAGRRCWALVPLLIAALIHPLQALPGVAVWWGLQVGKDKRWLALPVIAAVGATMLALVDVGDVEQLFSRYDTEWLKVIAEPNKHVYMLQWPATSWVSLLVDYFLVSTAVPHLAPRPRRYAIALLWISTLCFSMSMVLVDGFQFVWAAGVQPWRIHWLLHWSALMFAPVVILHLWVTQSKTQLALFAATMLAAAPYGPFASVYAAMITVPLYVIWPRISGKVGSAYVRLLHVSLTIAIFGTYLRYLLYLLGMTRIGGGELDWSKLFLGLSHPVALAPLVTIGLWLWLRRAKSRLVILGLLICAVFASVSRWDQRSPAKKFLESAQGSSNVFGQVIEPGATVFWHSDLLAPWMLLRRPSYWSELQQAGLLFNRGTAVEAQRRAVLLEPFQIQAGVCQIMDNLNKKQGSCEIDISAFHEPCRDEEAQVNYLILPFVLPIKKLGSAFFDDGLQWNSASNKTGGTYYLYSCKDVP